MIKRPKGSSPSSKLPTSFGLTAVRYRAFPYEPGAGQRQLVHMPTQQELPRGATRDFVEAIFSLYREARRPTLRDISKEIERSDSPAAASAETIRRMLRGTTIPSWQIVSAVVLALCRIAKVDPDADPGYDADLSRSELVELRWNEALDKPHELHAPTPSRLGRPEADPWATAEPGGFSDEPPF